MRDSADESRRVRLVAAGAAVGRGRGFIHRLPRGNVEGPIADLERLGFRVIRLDGSKIDDQPSFHDEVAEVFEFPDYHGRNWDAFATSF
jgi:hypothetical protein